MNQKFRLPVYISFLAILVFTVGCKPEPTPTPISPTKVANFNHQFRIYDSETKENIEDAKVTIEKSDGTPPEIEYTDSEGIASFKIINSELVGKLDRLIVESEGYETYTLNFAIATESLPINIPLNPLVTPTPHTFCMLISSIASSATNMLSGEKVTLILNANGSDLKYSWKADRGMFSRDDVAIVEYTAPIEPGTVTITAEVTDPTCNKTETAEIELIISPTTTPTSMPTICPVPNVEMVAEPEEMFVGETAVITINLATDETTSNWEAEAGTLTGVDSGEAEYVAPDEPGEYELSAIVENECGEQATALVTVQVNDVPPTAVTIVPTSPNISIDVPVIIRLEVISGDTLVVEWSWSGTLDADQFFAVRLWRVDNPDPTSHNSLIWQKEIVYQLKINNVEFPPGDYYLNIAVVEGPSYDNHRTIVKTEDFLTNLPNVEIPPAPSCPPVCTP